MPDEMFALIMIALESNAETLRRSGIANKHAIERVIGEILTIVVNAIKTDRDKFDLDATVLNSLHSHMKKWVPPNVPFHPSHN